MLGLSSLFAQYSSNTVSYSAESTMDPAAATSFLIIMLLLMIPAFIILAISIVGMWKMFIKAGKPGWASIVPVYNGMILAEIAGRPSWWGLGYLISPLNIVVAIIFGIDIARRFGKSDMFGVVALGIFSGIGYMLLGFGKDSYNASNQTTTSV